MNAQIPNAQFWQVKILGAFIAWVCSPSGSFGQLPAGIGSPPSETPPRVSTTISDPTQLTPNSSESKTVTQTKRVGVGEPGYQRWAKIGGVGDTGMYTQPPTPFVIWEKPQSVNPQWLVTGNNAIQANERIRQNLETASECDFSEVPLQQAIKELLDKVEVAYSINDYELEAAGYTPDVIVTLRGKGPTRELLRRLVTPLDLGYIVRENYVEITSEDVVLTTPILRTYDLAHVMANNQSLNELIRCIQTTIESHLWENGDATISSLGSLLVVSATDDVHHEISKLLAIRSQQPRGAGEAGEQKSNRE
jgi:hypothetical protein